MGPTARQKRFLSGAAGWLRRLLIPAPMQAGKETWSLPDGRALCCRGQAGGVPLVLSLGFGSALTDYVPLVEMLLQHQPVIRVEHPGSARRAGLEAGLRLLWRRWWLGEGKGEAARRVRAHLHRPASRERRLAQLREAVEATQQRWGTGPIDLAGHSFGTDTALLFALRHGHEVPIRRLILLCPHPPGYLVPLEAYAALPVDEVVVVTGTRDWTRDGVGPEARWAVVQASGGRGVMLQDVAHMDFAFPGLGPVDWPQQLERELFP
jgi:pimeloyl-ACP methyl ester carboxylesterase